MNNWLYEYVVKYKLIYGTYYVDWEVHLSCRHSIRARIFKLLRNPRIDPKEPIPPGCVAWRAGTTNLFLLGS
jgi:hypothetical protein